VGPANQPLTQRRRVRHALQCGVQVTVVSQVVQPGTDSFYFRPPRIEPHRARHQLGVARVREVRHTWTAACCTRNVEARFICVQVLGLGFIQLHADFALRIIRIISITGFVCVVGHKS